jgi:hypothetical protein
MKKEILIAVSLDDAGEFVAAYVKKQVRGKVHKTVDYKNRGTIFQDYTRSGKLAGLEFLRPNDFWRFIKALVTEKPKKKKKK